MGYLGKKTGSFRYLAQVVRWKFFFGGQLLNETNYFSSVIHFINLLHMHNSWHPSIIPHFSSTDKLCSSNDCFISCHITAQQVSSRFRKTWSHQHSPKSTYNTIIFCVRPLKPFKLRPI